MTTIRSLLYDEDELPLLGSENVYSGGVEGSFEEPTWGHVYTLLICAFILHSGLLIIAWIWDRVEVYMTRCTAWRHRLVLLFKRTRLGFVVESLNFALSLLQLILYIEKTYLESLHISLYIVTVFMQLYFVFYYFLWFAMSEYKVFYVLSISTVFDVLSLVSVLLSPHVGLYTTFEYLRIAHTSMSAQRAGLGEWSQYPILYQRIVEKTIITLATAALFASTIHMVELLGNPAWMWHDENQDHMSWAEAYYFIFVTITTVGYGDFSPSSNIGRVCTAAIIIMGVIFFSQSASEIVEIIAANRVGKGRMVRKMNDQHVVIIGDLTPHVVRDFAKGFREASRKDDPYHKIKLVVLSENASMGPDVKYFSDREFNGQILFFQGSPLNSDDMERVLGSRAMSFFVLADMFSKHAQMQDSRNVLRVLALKRFYPDCQIFATVCEVENKANFILAGVERRSCVCLHQLRMNLMGLNCLTLGASTVIGNLIYPHTSLQRPDKPEPWELEYMEGMKEGLFYRHLPKRFHHIPIGDTRRKMFYDHQLVLVAVGVPRSGTLDIVLNPPDDDPFLPPFVAIFISHVERIPKDFPMVEDYVTDDKHDLVFGPGAVGLKRSELRKIHPDGDSKCMPELPEQERNTSYQEPEGEGGDDDDHTDKYKANFIPGMFFKKEKRETKSSRGAGNRKRSVSARGDVPEHEILREDERIRDIRSRRMKAMVKNDNRNQYINTKKSAGKVFTAPLEDGEVPRLNRKDAYIKDHIVLTGSVHQCREIVKYLRTEDLRPFSPIVILANYLPETDRKMVASMEDVFHMMGDVTNSFDLQRACTDAAHVVICGDTTMVNNNVPGITRNVQMVDANAIMALITLENLHLRSHLCSEILLADNVKFLKRKTTKSGRDGLPSKPHKSRVSTGGVDHAPDVYTMKKYKALHKVFKNDIYAVRPRYAMGVLFVSTFIDGFTAKLFFEGHIMSICETIISGQDPRSTRKQPREDDDVDPLDRMRLITIQLPLELDGRTYKDVVEMCWDMKMTAIGLYRKSHTSSLHYVYTNPQPTLVVDREDLVYVLGSKKRAGNLLASRAFMFAENQAANNIQAMFRRARFHKAIRTKVEEKRQKDLEKQSPKPLVAESTHFAVSAFSLNRTNGISESSKSLDVNERTSPGSAGAESPTVGVSGETTGEPETVGVPESPSNKSGPLGAASSDGDGSAAERGDAFDPCINASVEPAQEAPQAPQESAPTSGQQE